MDLHLSRRAASTVALVVAASLSGCLASDPVVGPSAKVSLPPGLRFEGEGGGVLSFYLTGPDATIEAYFPRVPGQTPADGMFVLLTNETSILTSIVAAGDPLGPRASVSAGGFSRAIGREPGGGGWVQMSLFDFEEPYWDVPLLIAFGRGDGDRSAPFVLSLNGTDIAILEGPHLGPVRSIPSSAWTTDLAVSVTGRSGTGLEASRGRQVSWTTERTTYARLLSDGFAPIFATYSNARLANEHESWAVHSLRDSSGFLAVNPDPPNSLDVRGFSVVSPYNSWTYTVDARATSAHRVENLIILDTVAPKGFEPRKTMLFE